MTGRDDDRTPILVGAGQLTQQDVDPAEALEPVAMMEAAARRGAEDAGGGAALLARVDSVAVVNVLGWHYANAPGLLADRLGARPAETIYTTLGGNTPQWLVNETARKVAAGHVRLALLAGAEAFATLRRARRAGMRLRWTSDGGGSPTTLGDPRPGTSPHETAHGLQMPTQIYPLFENAYRARRGWTLDEHRRRLGTLCARLSAVASANPYAWFRIARRPEEITTVTPDNRMIAFPYPKYMNAIMEVDEAAAVLLTSVGEARALGIPPSRWVYLWGTADAQDLWFVSERIDYASSPALRAAARHALETAGLDVGAIGCFDLYSCFPSAVEIARDMLAIPADDRRPLTVTGGLPYFGGPGNNYAMHAIATMMARLRAAPRTTGLVSALGWYLTKHAVGVYATEPRPWRPRDFTPVQAELDAAPPPALVTEPRGRGTIETYTVVHDRDGTPRRGIVIGRLEDGRRFLANTPEDRPVLEALEAHEGIGRTGRVEPTDGVNRFDPD
jgi:acetyl-CoA C-acetyltransferase